MSIADFGGLLTVSGLARPLIPPRVWRGTTAIVMLGSQYSAEQVRARLQLALSPLAEMRPSELRFLANLLYRRDVNARFKWHSVASIGVLKETNEHEPASRS